MFYLLLTILGSAMVSILMRLSEGKIKNSIGMLEANYIICFFVSAALAGFGNLFPSLPGIGATQIMGLITGVLFLICYLVMQSIFGRFVFIRSIRSMGFSFINRAIYAFLNTE